MVAGICSVMFDILIKVFHYKMYLKIGLTCSALILIHERNKRNVKVNKQIVILQKNCYDVVTVQTGFIV